MDTLDSALMAHCKDPADEGLFEALLAACRPIVGANSRKFQVAGMEPQDIEQELNMAIWRQARNFDPSRGGARGWIGYTTYHRAITLMIDANRPKHRAINGVHIEAYDEDPEHHDSCPFAELHAKPEPEPVDMSRMDDLKQVLSPYELKVLSLYLEALETPGVGQYESNIFGGEGWMSFAARRLGCDPKVLDNAMCRIRAKAALSPEGRERLRRIRRSKGMTMSLPWHP